MFDREYRYFRKNQFEIARKYPSKFVVIYGEDVFGSFKNELEAYSAAKKRYAAGTFLIMRAIEDDKKPGPLPGMKPERRVEP